MPGTVLIRFADAGPPALYRLAGRDVVIRPALAGLERYRSSAAAVPALPPEAPGDDPGAAPGALVRRVHGMVADRERWVECRSRPGGGYLLEVEGIGRFTVARRGGDVEIATGLAATDRAAAAALGPALALALAWSGVWILHAAAVARGDGAVALVGPGGIGKSTLGRHLAAAPGGPWRPLTDDLLPLRLGSAGPETLPRYPQPRWLPGDGGVPAAPEALPLAAVCVLRRPEGEGAGGEGPACRRLAGRQAVAALVEQTVGASLLDGRLLGRHLDACARVAEAVPVAALSYPLGLERLPEVERVLGEWLTSLR